MVCKSKALSEHIRCRFPTPPLILSISPTGERGIYLKQQLKDKLIEHKQYIAKYGQDLPEIRNWTWKRGETQAGKPMEQQTGQAKRTIGGQG